MELIFGILAIGSVYIFDLYPQVNDDFEMVALPEDNLFKFLIILILVMNFCVCYFLEKWKNIFGLYEPYERAENKKKTWESYSCSPRYQALAAIEKDKQRSQPTSGMISNMLHA